MVGVSKVGNKSRAVAAAVFFHSAFGIMLRGDDGSNTDKRVQQRFEVTALFDFVGIQPSGLSFKVGDKIIVTNTHQDESGWWTGHLPDSEISGIFPGNYTDGGRTQVPEPRFSSSQLQHLRAVAEPASTWITGVSTRPSVFTEFPVGTLVRLFGLELGELNGLFAIVKGGPIMDFDGERYTVEIQDTPQVLKLSRQMQLRLRCCKQQRFKRRNIQLFLPRAPLGVVLGRAGLSKIPKVIVAGTINRFKKQTRDNNASSDVNNDNNKNTHVIWKRVLAQQPTMGLIFDFLGNHTSEDYSTWKPIRLRKEFQAGGIWDETKLPAQLKEHDASTGQKNQYDHDSRTESSTAAPGGKFPSTTSMAGIAEVQFDWSPQGADELKLVKGTYVVVLEKMADGWCLGYETETPEKQKIGMFPGNYVMVCQNVENELAALQEKLNNHRRQGKFAECQQIMNQMRQLRSGATQLEQHQDDDLELSWQDVLSQTPNKRSPDYKPVAGGAPAFGRHAEARARESASRLFF